MSLSLVSGEGQPKRHLAGRRDRLPADVAPRHPDSLPAHCGAHGQVGLLRGGRPQGQGMPVSRMTMQRACSSWSSMRWGGQSSQEASGSGLRRATGSGAGSTGGAGSGMTSGGRGSTSGAGSRGSAVVTGPSYGASAAGPPPAGCSSTAGRSRTARRVPASPREDRDSRREGGASQIASRARWAGQEAR